jgi:hypothetical protein
MRGAGLEFKCPPGLRKIARRYAVTQQDGLGCAGLPRGERRYAQGACPSNTAGVIMVSPLIPVRLAGRPQIIEAKQSPESG